MNKQKESDILLIFPPGGLKNKSFNYGIGLGFIKSYLEVCGINSEIFNSTALISLDECIKKILSYRPKLIGFTVYNTNYLQTLLICKKLKKYAPEIIIVFGGPTPTVESSHIFKHCQDVDICVKGEGEEVFLKLVQRLMQADYKLNKADLSGINGVSYRIGQYIEKGKPNSFFLDHSKTRNILDKYPSPYLTEAIPLTDVGSLGILTARGCNQDCIYCNCSVLSHRRIYTHSVSRVIDELKFLNNHKYKPTHISIFDDAFTLLPNRAARICTELITKNIKHNLSCLTRCDSISEELLDLMKACGFNSVWFSLESAVPRILRILGKVHPSEDIPTSSFDKEFAYLDSLKKMVSYAKKIGISDVGVSIMVGVPGETPQEAQETIDFVRKLDIDSYNHNYFLIYQGTSIYDNHKKYGYQLEHISVNQILPYTIRPFKTANIDFADKSKKQARVDKQDKKSPLIFSLISRRDSYKFFFDKVIFFADSLTEKMISWLHDNISFNSEILVVYSDKNNFKKYFKQNMKMFYDNLTPSFKLDSYYIESDDKNNTTIKILQKRLKFKKLSFKLFTTKDVLNNYDFYSEDINQIICREVDAEDAEKFIDTLKSCGSNDFVDFILDNPQPLFSTLCKWSKKQKGNCETLETAIIDKVGNIRLCWNGEPVGTVNNSFSDIINYLHELGAEQRSRRNCSVCSAEARCGKCYFPDPISEKKYCNTYRDNDFTIKVKQINNSYLLSEELSIFK